MDVLKLKWHMNEYGDKVPDLAKFLEVHRVTLYAKISGKKQEFTQSEIQRIANRYNLSNEDIIDIFFN